MRKGRTRDEIDHNVHRFFLQVPEQILIPSDDPIGSDFQHLLLFGRCRNSNHFGPSPFHQLKCGRTNPSGSTRDQYPFSGSDPGALDHVFRGSVGTGNGGQFGIAPVAFENKYFGLGDFDILGEGAVEIGTHPEVFHRFKSLRPDAGTDEDPFPEKLPVSTRTDFSHPSAAVGPLNERERGGFVPATIDSDLRLPDL